MKLTANDLHLIDCYLDELMNMRFSDRDNKKRKWQLGVLRERIAVALEEVKFKLKKEKK